MFDGFKLRITDYSTMQKIFDHSALKDLFKTTVATFPPEK